MFQAEDGEASGNVTVTLTVPDAPWMISALNRALFNLTITSLWTTQPGNSRTPDEAAEIFENVYASKTIS